MKQYKVITVTHRQVQLKDLGSFAIASSDEQVIKTRLEQLKQQTGIQEMMYLATCNRITYFFTSPASVSAPFVKNFFQVINPQLDISTQFEQLNIYEGQDAIEHLFEVSASIDSMVVGEREILRQLREAYAKSKEWNLIGDHLRLAMDFIVLAAKEVYCQTRIGEKPVSVVSLSIQQMMAQNLDKDARILIVGAGQTNNLVSKFLKKYEYQNVVVFNRTLARAERLAKMLNGSAKPLSDLGEYKEDFDAMFVCTGATEAVLTETIYTSMTASASAKKRLIIDLSVPNNVARSVADLAEVNYIEIEDLRTLAKKNLSFRQNEIQNAKVLLKQKMIHFKKALKERKIEKVFRNIPVEIKAVKQKAINEVFRKDLESLDDTSQALLLKMMDYMERKCVGIPMKAAREAALQSENI